MTVCAADGCTLQRTVGRWCVWHGDPRAESTETNDEPRGITSVEVCKATGVTYRQLDYWTGSGLIRPSVSDAAGSGAQRGWSDDDVAEITVIKQLLDRGLSLQAIRRIDKDRRAQLLDAIDRRARQRTASHSMSGQQQGRSASPYIAADHKRCPGCDTVKPRSEFHRASNRVDGLRTYCKPCNIAMVAASRTRRREDTPEPQHDHQPTLDAAEGKRCCTCKTVKPVTDFNRDRSRADGLNARCKTCRRAAARRSQRRNPNRRPNTPNPQPPVEPPAADERICTGCGKTLPLASYRIKPRGRSKKCIVCDGAESAPPEGPPPLPGQPEFTITITCNTCDHHDVTKHPHADDPDAITATTVRVDQALHTALHQCDGTLTGTWTDHIDEVPVSEIRPRRPDTQQLTA